MASALRKITLGGGNFWYLQQAFKKLRGILSATLGYSNGQQTKPTLNEVKKGQTEHIQIVQLEYNPHIIKTEQIIDIFFYLQDVRQTNGHNGSIVTSHAKSIIFYHDIDQKTVSENAIENLNASGKSVVIHLKPVGKIYPAESEHVDYCDKHPDDEFCRTVVKPRIERMSQEYSELLKPQKNNT